jgi:hypothetical protein
MLASYNQFENSGNVNIVDGLALTSPFEMSSSNTLFASVALSAVSVWYSLLSSELGSDKLSITLTCLASLFKHFFGWQCFLSSSPHSLRCSAARISCKHEFLFR